MHTLIGHELFHPRCKQFTTKLEKDVAADIAEQCKNAFPQLKPDTLWGQKELARMNNFTMFAWERALHELLCDMFCAEVFGPAALLAMAAYATFSEWRLPPTAETNFYPPWQYRFEVVWQQAIDKDALEKLWDEAFKNEEIREIAESFKRHLLDFKDQNHLESTTGFDFVSRLTQPVPFVPIAYQKVNEQIADAHAYVVSLLPQVSVKWSDEKVLKQIPKLLTRLQSGIPPNEIPNISLDNRKRKPAYSPEPAELPAILISGWMYQVYREKNVQTKKRNLLSYDTLARLVLKACEDSEMLRYS
jgi:hypothetical protein